MAGSWLVVISSAALHFEDDLIFGGKALEVAVVNVRQYFCIILVSKNLYDTAVSPSGGKVLHSDVLHGERALLDPEQAV